MVKSGKKWFRRSKSGFRDFKSGSGVVKSGKKWFRPFVVPPQERVRTQRLLSHSHTKTHILRRQCYVRLRKTHDFLHGCSPPREVRMPQQPMFYDVLLPFRQTLTSRKPTQNTTYNEICAVTLPRGLCMLTPTTTKFIIWNA